MCGFAGLIDPDNATEPVLRDAVTRMTASLVHCGPDDQGIWLDQQAGAALGHRRLSILDLSSVDIS